MSVRRWLCVALLCAPAIAGAQPFPLPLPRALVFPNYDNVLVGKDPQLEAGAFIARASDAAANFYNAAGLVNGERTSINASSDGYVWTQVGSKTLDTTISSSNFDNIPGFIGVLFGAPFIGNRNLRFGFSVARIQSWVAPGLDQSVLPPSGSAISRVTYSSSASLRTLLYQGGASWSPTANRSVRLGVTVGVGETSLNTDGSLSGELPTAGGSRLFLSSLRASGNEWDLLAGVSAQWDVLRSLTLGLTWRAPGIKIGSGSRVTFEGSDVGPVAPASYYFRDEEGAFRYKQPWEGTFGVAYRFGRAQVEADVRYHDAVDTYDLYRTDAQVQKVVQNPDGTTSTTTSPGPQLVYAARRVANFAVGGNYGISRSVTVHGGFYTSFSPVEDATTSAFRSADLYGITAGADVKIASFGLSVGAGYLFGSSSTAGLGLGELQTGQSDVTLRALSVVYAISYQF